LIALLLVLKAVFPAEAQFFGDARDAEWLAGKSGAEDVMFGNVGNRDGMDVAVRFFSEIGLVSLARLFVPVARENTFATGALEREPEPADATEQINETKFVVRAIAVDVVRRRVLAQCGGTSYTSP